DTIKDIAWLPDSHQLAIVTSAITNIKSNDLVVTWDIESDQVKPTAQGFPDVIAVQWSPDWKKVAVLTSGGVTVMDAASERTLYQVAFPTYWPPNNYTFSPNGELLAVAYGFMDTDVISDSAVAIIDANAGNIVATVTSNSWAGANVVAWSGDSRYLISG